MRKRPRWETRRIHCPEQKRTATLLIEWREKGGKAVINSITCDNPRLSDLDNWDCQWLCWDELASNTTD